MADFDGWSLTIAQDNMSAILYMEPPHDRNPYTVEETMDYIKKNGVTKGIIYSSVEKAIELRQYYKNVKIAEGELPVDGIAGYYDFFFDTSKIKTPAIRSDGSVDYSSMTDIETVKNGAKLATYHHPIPGSTGYDVRGRDLRCKPGKTLPPLRGKGFEIREEIHGEEEVTEYYALKDGRIDYNEYRLDVCDRYDHKGDLDLVTSRIDFRGDVVIHGNVRSGTVIRASKSITVEGSVEAATLIAEGDIILQKGMQGGKKAKIVCGGDLYANFIEFTDVSVKGNVEANVVLNSVVSAGKSIKISGRRGSIVGGTTYAVGLLESTNLGNQAEIKTSAAVGVTEELEKRNHMLSVKAEAARNGIKRAKAEIEVLSAERVGDMPPEVKAAKIGKLKKHIQRDERALERIAEELAETTSTINLGKNAVINIHDKIYAGTTVQVCGKSRAIETTEVGECFYAQAGCDEVMTRKL